MPNILHDRIEDWDYSLDFLIEENMQIDQRTAKIWPNGIHIDDIEYDDNE